VRKGKFSSFVEIVTAKASHRVCLTGIVCAHDTQTFSTFSPR